jgi:hypothetical protein
MIYSPDEDSVDFPRSLTCRVGSIAGASQQITLRNQGQNENERGLKNYAFSHRYSKDVQKCRIVEHKCILCVKSLMQG